MSDYGITDDGFVLKRLADIKLELETSLDALFANANVSGESVFGQLIGLFSDAQAQAWESFQLVANQYNPSNASGPNQSSLVQLNGLTRMKAEAGVVTLTLTGRDDTTIDAGSLVCNSKRTIYYSTDEDVTISSGTATVAATATETGDSESLAGTLTTIVNPISGWLTVTNETAATVGMGIESDEELRARRDISTLAPSQSVVESIYSNLLDISGVEFARVYVNETSVTDSRSIPSHSIACVVVGGDDDTIAETIHNRKPAGITAYGNTDVSVIDDQSFSYPISFIRPTEIPIYVNVTIKTDDSFPVDGESKIMSAIISYADGGADELGATDFGDEDGFPPGSDVVYSRMFTPLNSVEGQEVTSLFISTDSEDITGEETIPIAYDEVSSWDSTQITITIDNE